MKIKYPKEKQTVRLGDLSVGDTFYDIDGDLSIKTSMSNGGNNIICFVSEAWMPGSMDTDDEVTPVETELKVMP